jgi:hypothetical protein
MDKVKQSRQFRRLALQMRGHAKRTEGQRGEQSLDTARTFDEIAEGFERVESSTQKNPADSARASDLKRRAAHYREVAAKTFDDRLGRACNEAADELEREADVDRAITTER